MTHLVAQQTPAPYDAILFLSFGGPEGSDDVIPFLENVLRGRNVPRERMLQVAEQYQLFGGKSPINDQVRALITALEKQLAEQGPNLPTYWGNRNWHPLLTDTLRKMASDGIQRALVFVTSAYSSYSGCRQYREDIARAQAAVGENAPALEKLRVSSTVSWKYLSIHACAEWLAFGAVMEKGLSWVLPCAAKAWSTGRSCSTPSPF
jgi:ferrochelatase